MGLAHWCELRTREQKILLMDFRGGMTQYRHLADGHLDVGIGQAA